MLRRTLLKALPPTALSAALPLPALAANNRDADQAERWKSVRETVFPGRSISEEAAGLIELDTPARAFDAAVVPVAIRIGMAQTPERYVKKLWLVVDGNPSPVGAVFTFTPESGRADIETRIRIEEYTHVRAIVETSDGKLFMKANYVKAAGGCSAPAGKDAEAALASLGKMKLRVDGDAAAGKPVLAQLMVSHPNVSGLAIDQFTRIAPAPYFVRSIEVRYAGKPVLTADVDFTISENPSLRFYFLPKGAGELQAKVVDTKDLEFQSSIAVKPKT